MRNIFYIALAVLACLFAAGVAEAQVQAPERVAAGSPAEVQTAGTLYVSGPGFSAKLKAEGGKVTLTGDQLKHAGRYLLSDGNSTRVLWVVAAEPGKLNFLAQPSRVPAARPDVISGTTFIFDRNNNLVLQPMPVKFDLSVAGTTASRTVTAKDGVAWTRMGSASREGNANFVATAGAATETRVVRLVAGEPCNLHMTARPHKMGVWVETAPIRDCSGNAVPDGTIVTFTQTDAKGKSTVDARIKKGIATAILPNNPGATISVAAGVMVGNEVRWGGSR